MPGRVISNTNTVETKIQAVSALSIAAICTICMPSPLYVVIHCGFVSKGSSFYAMGRESAWTWGSAGLWRDGEVVSWCQIAPYRCLEQSPIHKGKPAHALLQAPVSVKGD
ncbi:hypothetical protein GCM10027276_08950 [Comamonas piscis]